METKPDNKKWLRILVGLLLDQGLKLLVPYVRIISNPIVKWVLRAFLSKILDRHLGRAEEVKEALDYAKLAPEVREKLEAKAKAKEKMKAFVRRQPF